MGSRSRGSKAKTTKDAMKHPRLSALVQSSPITKRRSSAGDHVRDHVDAKLDALDLLNNGTSVRRWPQNFSGREDSTPGRSQMSSLRQEETASASDWVMVSSIPEKESDTWMSTSTSLTTPPDTSMAMFSRPESMRPPELRPKLTSPRGGNTAQQSEIAPSTKRLSIVEAAGDSSTKRTRSDLSQKTAAQPTKERNRDEDENDSDATSKAPGQHCEEPVPASSFACPYYRLDPVAHQQCLKYTLNRIRDMKQHLSRRHYGATCYCPICFRTFPSFNLRDEHIRCRNCVSKPSPSISNIDAVSPKAQEQLKQRVDRTVSPEDQWHAVYEILFGKPVGKRVDPYIRSVVRETLGMVRAFLRATGSRIIPRIVESSGNQDAQHMNFEKMMHGVFDEVETQFDNLTEPRKGITRTASTRPTSFPTIQKQQALIPSVVKSENILFSEPLGFSSEFLAGGRAEYRLSPVLMPKSYTFPGTNAISSAASSTSDDLARSCPSYYFQLPSTFGDPGFRLPEYYSPDSLNYPSPAPMAGFASESPLFMESPTVRDPESDLIFQGAWQDSSNFTGIGGAFPNYDEI